MLEQKRLIMARRQELGDYMMMVFSGTSLPFEISSLDASIKFYKDIEQAFSNKIYAVLEGKPLDKSPEANDIRYMAAHKIDFEVSIAMKIELSANEVRKMLSNKIAFTTLGEIGPWFGNVYYEINEVDEIDVYIVYFSN